MSKDGPRLTAEEAKILNELAEMRTSDPEGYAAVMQDTARGAQDADPARAHGEWLLGRLADDDWQRGEIMDLMNRAWRQAAEENRNDY